MRPIDLKFRNILTTVCLIGLVVVTFQNRALNRQLDATREEARQLTTVLQDSYTIHTNKPLLPMESATAHSDTTSFCTMVANLGTLLAARATERSAEETLASVSDESPKVMRAYARLVPFVYARLSLPREALHADIMLDCLRATQDNQVGLGEGIRR